MPRELDEAAQRIWKEVAPQLVSMGTLATMDGGTLAGYCAALSSALASQKLVQEAAATWARQKEAAEARRLWAMVDRFAQRLGLNFAARGRG